MRSENRNGKKRALRKTLKFAIKPATREKLHQKAQNLEQLALQDSVLRKKLREKSASLEKDPELTQITSKMNLPPTSLMKHLYGLRVKKMKRNVFGNLENKQLHY